MVKTGCCWVTMDPSTEDGWYLIVVFECMIFLTGDIDVAHLSMCKRVFTCCFSAPQTFSCCEYYLSWFRFFEGCQY